MRELVLDVDERWGRRAGLERALRDAIRSGRLQSGSTVPSSRTLAADLGYSRTTVVCAYEQLVAEGYLATRQGLGTVVATVHSPPSEPDRPMSITRRFVADFRPGEPDVSLFPRQDWQRSMRHMLATVPDASLGYPDPRGAFELRSTLADYLARARAVVATPDAVSVFAGFASAIGFVTEMLVRQGVTEIAVEDPTLFITRDILRLAGATPVAIPVDEEGIDVEALARSTARAVVVTPSHQYPLGVTMSPERRSALVEWAHRCDGWIIEDDYDGEFRYDRQPVGSLQGLDPSRVVYAGTASKSLIPGLRIAWLVVPAQLRGRLGAVKHIRGATSILEQLTLSHFIDSGRLDRHLRASRTIYRKRQLAVVDALIDRVPSLEVSRSAAGLHLCCELPDSVVESDLVRAAVGVEVGLMGLASHFMEAPNRRGLVIGYSRPPQHQFVHALDRLLGFLEENLAT